MLVFDTSAYLNGWRDHYPPKTFPSVWKLIENAMVDQRIITPREVLNELRSKDDDVASWAKTRAELFVEPSGQVQSEAGIILAMLPNPGIRDGADPFVVAEAKVRRMTLPEGWCRVSHGTGGASDARSIFLALSSFERAGPSVEHTTWLEA
jgi:hypothetical protein